MKNCYTEDFIHTCSCSYCMDTSPNEI